MFSTCKELDAQGEVKDSYRKERNEIVDRNGLRRLHDIDGG
jgi:hypothetical protein